MGTLGNPKIWVQPYINPKIDCSQGICGLACPQWCYLIFPPPPPPFTFSDDNSSSSSSGPTLSPLAITIIGVLASAFLLVSYYAILSKYCGNSEASSSIENQLGNSDGDEVERDEDNNLNEHEPWVVRTTGLDEALIKSITLLKYKKGDGLVASGDCSVCLGEFQEDESLRLLPKCSHAFHVECIDTWLRSHSTCPLCRATIFSTATSRPPLQPPPPLVVDENSNHRNRHHHPPHQDQESSSIQSQEENRIGDHQEEASGRNLPKSPFRALSDLGLHVGEEGHVIRRSISMDHFHETRLSIFDISRMDHKEGSKEAAAGESSKSGSGGGGETSRSGLFHSVVNSVSLKRSFSSGRFLFTKHGRGRNAVIPL